jgi:hypothetical protein
MHPWHTHTGHNMLLEVQVPHNSRLARGQLPFVDKLHLQHSLRGLKITMSCHDEHGEGISTTKYEQNTRYVALTMIRREMIYIQILHTCSYFTHHLAPRPANEAA